MNYTLAGHFGRYTCSNAPRCKWASKGRHKLGFTNVCSDASTFEDSQAHASIHTGINTDHYAQFIKFGFTN